MNIEIGALKANDRLALRALWKEAFGDTDEFLNLFEQTAYSPKRARRLTVDGTCAAALYWFDCECDGQKIAYLYAIATAKAYRGQGLCRMLMEDTHKHLRTLGYTAAILVPSEESLFGFYEKLGYAAATRISEFACEASDETVELLRIGEEEYGTLRRAMLPVGGVVQERDNLCYLSAQAELYRGEGVLLAARREKETLVGIELLGDVSAAPKILCTLSMPKGKFRTVGQDREFSMILFLNAEKGQIPTYFGLAFD